MAVKPRLLPIYGIKANPFCPCNTVYCFFMLATYQRILKEGFGFENMSKTAKSGFKNEDFIKESIQNHTKLGLEILKQIKINDFDQVVTGREIGKATGKSDVIIFEGKKTHGISIKRINGNFNQLDKRKVDNYLKLWDMNKDTITGLKKFCGEIIPDHFKNKKTRDKRRYFMDELDEKESCAIINFFTKNKDRILHDIFIGRGEHPANWLLIAQYEKNKFSKYKMITMQEAIDFFGNGNIGITKCKSIKIGKITLQRKGGNGGGPTARLLQFKIKPREIL